MDQIYVVEGRNDITRLKQLYPNINIVSVNGSAINADIVDMLRAKVATHEIILCMDPDYAGERIRTHLSKELKEVTHIFIKKADAHNYNHTKIGFEHVTDEVLEMAFSKHMKANENSNSDITMNFLYELGLVCSVNSKRLRRQLSDTMNLGHVNGKTLLNRLNSFGITKAEVIVAIEKGSA